MKKPSIYLIEHQHVFWQFDHTGDRLYLDGSFGDVVAELLLPNILLWHQSSFGLMEQSAISVQMLEQVPYYFRKYNKFVVLICL